jgi:hypothetical protein
LPEGTPPDFSLIWFGIILAMNLQTSFLTPPFGFALFYLRSVAAKKDYKDRVTGQNIPAVTTPQIYMGSIAFIILQLIMVMMVIMYPALVSGNIEQGKKIDADKALQEMMMPGRESSGGGSSQLEAPAPSRSEKDDDPMSVFKNQPAEPKK